MRGKGREKCPLKLLHLDFRLSCDDAHSTSSKGGRADPAAIAAAAAAPSAAAPSAVVVTLGCITRAAVAPRH